MSGDGTPQIQVFPAPEEPAKSHQLCLFSTTQTLGEFLAARSTVTRSNRSSSTPLGPIP
ncbi:hypothetical protein ACFS27_14320 [Promicromonospora vindobonensis]|uniref:Uncharacterized protein n=1 Tax=Promicromonospora vindobonensis TaxID=195748 RepID=A0ABW5VU01_9MICO